MQVTDENGDVWQVAKGDPAAEPANLLKKMGYQVVRLPLRVILDNDDLPYPTQEGLEAIDSEQDAARFIRYASLLDQWTALVWYGKLKEEAAVGNKRPRPTAAHPASTGLLD